MAPRHGSAVFYIGVLADRPVKLDRAGIFYATDNGSQYLYDPLTQAWTQFSGGGVGGYNQIEDEGTPLTQRATIDVRGQGLTASDDSGASVTAITLGAISTLGGVITEAQHGAKSTATDHAAFGASGAGHAAGFVPDPGAVAGSAKFLREDAAWATVTAAGPYAPVGIYTYVVQDSIVSPGQYGVWLHDSPVEQLTNADAAVCLQYCNDQIKAAVSGGSIGVRGVLSCFSAFLWDAPCLTIAGSGWVKEKGVPPIAAATKILWDSGSILHGPFVQMNARNPQLYDCMISGEALTDTSLLIGGLGSTAAGGTVTNGSNIITAGSGFTAGTDEGKKVTGSGIPSGSKIVSVSGVAPTQVVVMTKNASATHAGEVITIIAPANTANRCIMRNVAIANGRVDTLVWASADGEWVEGECRTDPGSGSDPTRYCADYEGGNLNIVNVHHHGIGTALNGGRVMVLNGAANSYSNCHSEAGVGGDGLWNIECGQQRVTWTGGKWGYMETGGELLVSSGGYLTAAGVTVMPQGLNADNTYTAIEVDQDAGLNAGQLTWDANPNDDNFFKYGALLQAKSGGTHADGFAIMDGWDITAYNELDPAGVAPFRAAASVIRTPNHAPPATLTLSAIANI